MTLPSNTSRTIQIWVGAKLFAGHGGRMKYMFRLRDQVNGGALQGSGATTDFISLGQPTTIQFIIPQSRIFWGVNPPLPMTFQSSPGPNALPPPAIPGMVTEDLIFCRWKSCDMRPPDVGELKDEFIFLLTRDAVSI